MIRPVPFIRLRHSVRFVPICTVFSNLLQSKHLGHMNDCYIRNIRTVPQAFPDLQNPHNQYNVTFCSEHNDKQNGGWIA